MADQSWGSEQYVGIQFRRFYASSAKHVKPPTEINCREFGFLSFGGRSMFRHIGFSDVIQLRGYLQEYHPAHSYFSAAYYNDPRASMESKGWLGADLVFDIDSDHFDIPCQKEHDRWTCRTCGKEGTGQPPETCPDCGKSTYIEEKWLCSRCLQAAKYEAQKLIDILVQDFGFSESQELTVNFSGNRGYHVHVRSMSVRNLNQVARREIVDYIMGIGIEAEYQGFTSYSVGGGSTLTEGGWRTRTVKALYDFVEGSTLESIKELKLGKVASERLLDGRDDLLSTLLERHPSSVYKHVSKKTLERLVSESVDEQASAIDTVVTTDLRRLIRLPNTLHGKTGWLTQEVSLDELADYDPMTEAIAFVEGTQKIYVRRVPLIEIAGERYGPYEEEVVELPMAVAMFILCRRAGRVVG
jgi:DNA primase small subunit